MCIQSLNVLAEKLDAFDLGDVNTSFVKEGSRVFCFCETNVGRTDNLLWFLLESSHPNDNDVIILSTLTIFLQVLNNFGISFLM